MTLDNKHEFLLKNYFSKSKLFIKRKWRKLYKTLMSSNTPIRTYLHGYKASIPSNYQYPFFIRMFPKYNNPIIECIYQQHNHLQRRVNFIDVGAAVGDTVMLANANCPNMMGDFLCVEGDAEFVKYASENLHSFKNGRVIHCMLTDQEKEMPTLIRHHQNSATATGTDTVPATTLTHVCHTNNFLQVDVIKIDVDGYDGNVLLGSIDIIQKNNPVVIFEWHPKLYMQAGNEVYAPFEVLKQCGYNTFIWFDKYGNFSHFLLHATEDIIALQKDLCIQASFDTDWHYDVVALHATSTISPISFANSDYSKQKKVPY